MSSAHIAKAARLAGRPTSVTIDVYSESEPTRRLATVPNRDIARLGDSDVYQVDLLACSVSAVFDGSSGAEAPRSYTLIWRDDAGSQVVTTERITPPQGARSLQPAAFKLFVAGKGLKSESQLAQVRRQLTEKLGREPHIELIDILDDPGSALAAQVIATPALVQVTGWTGRPGRT
jgi:hypothetical protein